MRDLTAAEVNNRGAAASAEVPAPARVGVPVIGRTVGAAFDLGVRTGELTALGKLDTVVFGFVVDGGLVGGNCWTAPARVRGRDICPGGESVDCARADVRENNTAIKAKTLFIPKLLFCGEGFAARKLGATCVRFAHLVRDCQLLFSVARKYFWCRENPWSKGFT